MRARGSRASRLWGVVRGSGEGRNWLREGGAPVEKLVNFRSNMVSIYGFHSSAPPPYRRQYRIIIVVNQWGFLCVRSRQQMPRSALCGWAAGGAVGRRGRAAEVGAWGGGVRRLLRAAAGGDATSK